VELIGIWEWIENNRLYQRVSRNRFLGRLVNRETVSYIFFGVLTTVVSIGSYAAFLRLFEKNGWLGGDSAALANLLAEHAWLRYFPQLSESLRVFAANILSWVLAVAFAFVTNKLFVFDSKSRRPAVVFKELAGFVGSRLFSLFAETFIILFMVSALRQNEIFAKIIGQIVVLVLNYILSKVFVFRKQRTVDSD